METHEKSSSFVELMRQWFVSKEIFELRFSPIEKLVYGFTGMVLIAFAGGIIAFIFKR